MTVLQSRAYFRVLNSALFHVPARALTPVDAPSIINGITIFWPCSEQRAHSLASIPNTVMDGERHVTDSLVHAVGLVEKVARDHGVTLVNFDESRLRAGLKYSM
jgi:hypothetical protein